MMSSTGTNYPPTAPPLPRSPGQPNPAKLGHAPTPANVRPLQPRDPDGHQGLVRAPVVPGAPHRPRPPRSAPRVPAPPTGARPTPRGRPQTGPPRVTPADPGAGPARRVRWDRSDSKRRSTHSPAAPKPQTARPQPVHPAPPRGPTRPRPNPQALQRRSRRSLSPTARPRQAPPPPALRRYDRVRPTRASRQPPFRGSCLRPRAPAKPHHPRPA